MVGPLFMSLGMLILVVGALWGVVVAFRESVLWGIGCLVVPFVSLVFLVMFWAQAKNPFFVQLAGGALLILGVVLGGAPVETAAVP